MRSILALGVIVLSGLMGAAQAQTGDKFVIGVMGDQSGVVSDVGGKGSVLAARMAVADFGGQVLGKRIEILVADHQNKPDVASPIARRWFDTEGVEAIFDLPHTGVVLALQNIAREKQKSLLVSGAASVEITGKSCSPFTTHWTDDTYALANATAKAVTKGEGETWYFLTADYSFGHDLERDASNTIRALGGKVLGSSRHPLSTQDFSAYLLQAQSTKAKVIGLASAGADTVNAIKQAKEYKIDANGVRLAALRLHHRRQQPRPGDGAGPDHHQRLLLGCDRRHARLGAAFHGRARPHADPRAGRCLRLGVALSQGGPGRGQGRRSSHQPRHAQDAGRSLRRDGEGA